MEQSPIWLTDMQVPRVDLVKLPANNAPASGEGKVTGGLVDNGSPAVAPPQGPGQSTPPPNRTRPSMPHAPNQDPTQAVIQGLQHLVQMLQAAGDDQSQALAAQLAGVLEHLMQPGESDGQNDNQTQAVAGGFGDGAGQDGFGAPPKPVANPDQMPNAGGRRRQGPLFFPVSNSAIPSNIRRAVASLVRYSVRNGMEDLFASETIGAAEMLGDHFREGHDHLLCQHSICEAVLTSKERNDLPKSEFAYVDESGKGHLPLKDAAHVRNALSRFDETDMPESAKSGAMAKIQAAAKRFGVKVERSADDEDVNSMKPENDSRSKVKAEGDEPRMQNVNRAGGSDTAGRKNNGDVPLQRDGGNETAGRKNNGDVPLQRAGGNDTAGRKNNGDVPLQNSAKDPDKDGDDDTTPKGDTDHDVFDKDGKRIKRAAGGKTPTGALNDQDKLQNKCDYSEVAGAHVIGMVEATGKPRGSVWDVALIRSGMSLNRNFYSADALRNAVGSGLFEGVKAYADHPSKSEELSRPERSVRDIVGFYSRANWSEATNEVRAHLHVTSPWLREAMLEAYEAGNPNLYGFSIRADGRADVERSADGRPFQSVKALTHVASVDVVTDPAAGGRTVELLASNRPVTSDQEGSMEENGATSLAEVKALKDEATAALAETRRILFESKLEKALAESRLPEQGQARVRSLFEGKGEGDVAAAIVAERDYISSVTGYGMRDHGGARIQVVETDLEKVQKAMDGMFEQKNVDGVPAFRSLREAYSKITGIPDYDIDPYKWLYESYIGTASEAGTNSRLRESVTTASWTHVFGDSITRKMLKEYQLPGYDSWKQIVSEISNIKDFRTQRRLRMGGYGTLPTVAQGGAYIALTSPTDEEATFAISKRGGTEQLTMEMLVNDDLGAVRRIPTKLGRAAAMTLYRFVFGFLNDNTTLLWDGLTTYDVALGHANYTTNPLTSDNLTTAKVAMRKQVGYNMPANDALLTEPKFIVVAPDLDPAVRVLMESDKLPGTLDNDVNIHKGSLTPIVVNFWTAPRQWFLVGDPNLINTFEIGFLNGKQEPELFVQDMQNVGVMFDSDQIKYKLRHIYGGATVEYRGLHGNFAP